MKRVLYSIIAAIALLLCTSCSEKEGIDALVGYWIINAVEEGNIEGSPFRTETPERVLLSKITPTTVKFNTVYGGLGVYEGNTIQFEDKTVGDSNGVYEFTFSPAKISRGVMTYTMTRAGHVSADGQHYEIEGRISVRAEKIKGKVKDNAEK